MVNIMKTYIIPNTEMINLTAAGIMQSLNIQIGSGAPKVDNGDTID